MNEFDLIRKREDLVKAHMEASIVESKDTLEKGRKPLPEGTIRTYGKRKVIKKNGKWVKYVEPKKGEEPDKVDPESVEAFDKKLSLGMEYHLKTIGGKEVKGTYDGLKRVEGMIGTKMLTFTLTGGPNRGSEMSITPTKAGMKRVLGRTQRNKAPSWVIRNKETGEVVFQTFDEKKVRALNTKKYEAVSSLKHLQEFNKKVKDNGGEGPTKGPKKIKPEDLVSGQKYYYYVEGVTEGGVGEFKGVEWKGGKGYYNISKEDNVNLKIEPHLIQNYTFEKYDPKIHDKKEFTHNTEIEETVTKKIKPAYRGWGGIIKAAKKYKDDPEGFYKASQARKIKFSEKVRGQFANEYLEVDGKRTTPVEAIKKLIKDVEGGKFHDNIVKKSIRSIKPEYKPIEPFILELSSKRFSAYEAGDVFDNVIGNSSTSRKTRLKNQDKMLNTLKKLYPNKKGKELVDSIYKDLEEGNFNKK